MYTTKRNESHKVYKVDKGACGFRNRYKLAGKKVVLSEQTVY